MADAPGNSGGGSGPGSVGQLCPQPVSGVDVSRFRLDPITSVVLRSVDGSRTVDDIVARVGRPEIEIIRRLKLLSDGGLVRFAAREEAPRGTLPPPTPITRPKERFGGSASERIAEAEAAPRDGEEPQKTEGTVIARGELGSRSAKSVVDEAAAGSLTGTVTFSNDRTQVVYHFEKGMAKAVESSEERHDLGAMFREAGFLDAEGYRVYRAFLQKHPDKIIALRRAGLQDPKQLARHLSWHGREVFKEISEWTRGSFQVVDGVPFPDHLTRCRLRIVQPAEQGAGGRSTTPPAKPRGIAWRKGNPTPQQEEYLAARMSKYLVPSEAFAQVVARMRLADKEKRLVRHIDEGCPMQLRKCFTISTLMRSLTRKLLYTLLAEEAFELHDTDPTGSAPITLEDLQPLYEEMAGRNHFDVLAAHAVSIGAEIRQRYEAALRMYDTRRFIKATPEHLETLRLIHRRIENAYKVLSSVETRRAYRKEVFTAFQLANFFDLQMQKAQTAFAVRMDFEEAARIAESAWELRPQDPIVLKMIQSCLTKLGRPQEYHRFTQTGSEEAPRNTVGYSEIPRR